MKLTRRQEQFISNLIDLSDEFDGPIHYSVVAERLGVGPFTAYDMLCLLEEKGLVSSEYKLPEGKPGPGRAERLFYPNYSTARKEMLAGAFGGRYPDKEEHKKFVLERIQSGDFLDHEVATEILAGVPDLDQSDVSYCVEIMTIVALRLRKRVSRKLLLNYLPLILSGEEPTRDNLSLLGGFAFGVLAQECVPEEEWVQKLFLHIQRYLKIVLQLNQEECKQLAGALAEVFTKLEAENDGG